MPKNPEQIRLTEIQPRPTPSGPHDPVPLIPPPPAPVPKPPDVQKNWWSFLYDRETKEYCGRTCRSWLLIIIYSLVYMLFLSVFTMLVLFVSLLIIKTTKDFTATDDSDLYKLIAYPEEGIGLSATPTSLNSHPLIWYKQGDEIQYEPYVKALDKLLDNQGRKKRDVSVKSELGPCGSSPYGYGDEPCIILRINKQLGWSAKPFPPNSPEAKDMPLQVQKWLELKAQKLWLHCSGYYPSDKEHIGSIKYYPDPPGFDPSRFPQNMSTPSQLVAVQLSRITLGISLAIECKLYYDRGPSTMNFVIYIAPDKPMHKKLHQRMKAATQKVYP